jgi:hypothetical protein
MKGISKNWHISDNSFDQNHSNSPGPLSIDSTVINNLGYNPVGIIANPWHLSGDLTSAGGGHADRASGQLYTVRQRPKTVIVAKGQVIDIAIDGTPTSLSAGVFKLRIGETIAVTYSLTPNEQSFGGLISE